MPVVWESRLLHLAGWLLVLPPEQRVELERPGKGRLRLTGGGKALPHRPRRTGAYQQESSSKGVRLCQLRHEPQRQIRLRKPLISRGKPLAWRLRLCQLPAGLRQFQMRLEVGKDRHGFPGLGASLLKQRKACLPLALGPPRLHQADG